MRLFSRVILLIVCCMLFPAPFMYAGDSTSLRHITGQQWSTLSGDKAFGYRKDIEQLRMPPKQDFTLLKKIMKALGSIFRSGFAEFLLWALVILVIVYVIYVIALNSGNFAFSRKKRTMGEQIPIETGDAFEETDWERLQQKALRDNDLRMATRYTYMRLLQLMQQRQLIQYREDKTNFEYYREIENTPLKQPFKQLTRQYEYAFYGNYIPNQEAYNEYEKLFNDVKKQLGQ